MSTIVEPRGLIRWTHDGVLARWEDGGSPVSWIGAGEALTIQLTLDDPAPAYGTAPDFMLIGIYDDIDAEGVF